MLRGAARVAAVVALLAAPPGVGGHLLDPPKPLSLTEPAPRLHIISISGLKNIAVSVGMQRTCKRRMSSADSYANVCDLGCANQSRGALDNVVEMGDSSLPHALPSSDYSRAQVKYSFGLVQEVRRLSQLGGPLPAWWFLKDYDTFVNADRLMAWVEVRASPEDLASFGQIFSREDEAWTDQISGGNGWLLSRAMARKLGLDLGAEVLEFGALGCDGKPCLFCGGCRTCHPPQGLPWFALEHITGSRLENSSAFVPDPPCAGAATIHLKAVVESYTKRMRKAWTAEDAELALDHTVKKIGC